MTWKVKSRDNPESNVFELLADTPEQALDLLADQRARGREAWIETADGRPVKEEALKDSGS